MLFLGLIVLSVTGALDDNVRCQSAVLPFQFDYFLLIFYVWK